MVKPLIERKRPAYAGLFLDTCIPVECCGLIGATLDKAERSMEEWSRFWRQGHTTTFGDYFSNGYAGPVKDWLDGMTAALLKDRDSLNVVELLRQWFTSAFFTLAEPALRLLGL